MGIPWLTYLQALCKTIGQSPIKDRNVRFGDVADCLILYIIEKPSPGKALRFLVTFLMCIVANTIKERLRHDSGEKRNTIKGRTSRSIFSENYVIGFDAIAIPVLTHPSKVGLRVRSLL